MKDKNRWLQLQEDKPFLGGALIGLSFGIAMALTDLLFGGEVNLAIAAVMIPVVILICSLLMGLSARSRRRKSG